MHVDADLLHSICYECPGKTPVVCRIRHEIAIAGRKFRMGVHRSDRQIAMCHASALKYLLNILALRHEQSARGPRH